MTVRNPLTMMFMDDEYRVQDCKVWGTTCTGICFACCVYKGGAAKVFLKLSTPARPFPTPPPLPPPPQHQNNKKMLPTFSLLSNDLLHAQNALKVITHSSKENLPTESYYVCIRVIIKREEIVDIIYLYMFWWSQHKNIIAREQLIFTRLQWMHDIHNLLIRWALQVQALSYLFISSHYLYVKKLWG